MPPYLLALALGAGALTTGCVAMGANYDESAVEKLTPGMGKAEVIAMLGRPTSTVTLGDRSQQLNWTYSQGMMFRATARSLTLIFGPDGKYQKMLAEARTEVR